MVVITWLFAMLCFFYGVDIFNHCLNEAGWRHADPARNPNPDEMIYKYVGFVVCGAIAWWAAKSIPD